MADEKMEKKKQKEIQERKNIVLMYLKEAEKLNEKIKAEDKESKRVKLQTKFEKSRDNVKRTTQNYAEAGGEMQELIKELNAFQLSMIEELFPRGTDRKSIETEKEIQRYKKQIDDIKKAADKDGYEADWPFERKRKTKQYAEHDHLYRMIKLHSEIDHKRYVDIWNYKRDYEATKDKYFTPEEQAIIAECLAVEEERKVWFAEKYPWRIELGDKIIAAGERAGNAIGLAAAKIDAENLATEAFPAIIRKMYDEKGEQISDKEVLEESRLLTRRYIDYRRDLERELQALKIFSEAVGKAEVLMDENVHKPLEETAEELDSLGGLLADIAVNRVKGMTDGWQAVLGMVQKMLEKEYGQEESYFMMSIFVEEKKFGAEERESRREHFCRYTFEEMGI